jgi:hypothetical protein
MVRGVVAGVPGQSLRQTPEQQQVVVAASEYLVRVVMAPVHHQQQIVLAEVVDLLAPMESGA